MEKLRAVEREGLKTDIPAFAPGDTLRVMVRVREGEKERLQAFEGICIARRGGGVNETFTVRKISAGVGVERIFPLHAPSIAEIEGTAPFMAPEQASRSWGPIDVRTDVYGLGAVLYTLLTGRPPWVGRRLPDILADVISAAPVIPPTSLRPDLPIALSDLCRKCLTKDPEDRYRTVQEVRSVLTSLLGHVDRLSG